MVNNDQHFINKQKLLYKTLQPCYCKSVEETVHFTSEGINHLLYKRGRPRNKKEQVYRVALIGHIVEVISDATVAVKSIDPQFGNEAIWILEHKVKAQYKGKDQIIKVVLRKRGAGSAHFMSAMCRFK